MFKPQVHNWQYSCGVEASAVMAKFGNLECTCDSSCVVPWPYGGTESCYRSTGWLMVLPHRPSTIFDIPDMSSQNIFFSPIALIYN